MYNRYCDGVIHIVKKGDTLYELSKLYNVPLAMILRANPYIDVYNMGVGMRICIPKRWTERRYYEMELQDYSNNKNMQDMDDMQDMNRMREMDKMQDMDDMQDMNRMREMDKMQDMNDMQDMDRMREMDEEQNMNRMQDMDDIGGSHKTFAYIVKEGDSLKDIIDKFGLEMDDILKHNKLSDMLLKPGSTIIMPLDE